MVHGVPVVQLVRGGGEMFGGLWMGGFARLRPGPAITIHSSPSLGPLFSYQSRRPNHANHASHNSHKKRLKKRKLEERRSTRTRQPQSTKPPTPELLPAAFTRQVWDYTSVQVSECIASSSHKPCRFHLCNTSPHHNRRTIFRQRGKRNGG